MSKQSGSRGLPWNICKPAAYRGLPACHGGLEPPCDVIQQGLVGLIFIARYFALIGSRVSGLHLGQWHLRGGGEVGQEACLVIKPETPCLARKPATALYCNTLQESQLQPCTAIPCKRASYSPALQYPARERATALHCNTLQESELQPCTAIPCKKASYSSELLPRLMYCQEPSCPLPPCLLPCLHPPAPPPPPAAAAPVGLVRLGPGPCHRPNS